MRGLFVKNIFRSIREVEGISFFVYTEIRISFRVNREQGLFWYVDLLAWNAATFTAFAQRGLRRPRDTMAAMHASRFLSR